MTYNLLMKKRGKTKNIAHFVYNTKYECYSNKYTK